MQAEDETQKGLSQGEAARRLKRFGPNELPSPERRSDFAIALGVVRQPMFALLLCGGIIYLMLGEALDAVVLALFATFSVTIGIVQESRSEKVLESLRSLASPRALVIRDGTRMRIAGRDLVPGDVVILGEGDRVPADAQLFSGEGVEADESLLTGESVAVRKLASTSPAGVSATVRLLRSSNPVPSRRSRFRIAFDSDGWAIPSRAAARPKCSSSATARKYASSRVSS